MLRPHIGMCIKQRRITLFCGLRFPHLTAKISKSLLWLFSFNSLYELVKTVMYSIHIKLYYEFE